MKFFNEISNLLPEGVDLNLTIRKNGGELTVSIIPKTDAKDEAKNSIIPLVVSGTPEELESGFMNAISKPITKVTGLLIGMSEFEKQSEIAASNSKSEKVKKDNYDKLIKKSEQFEKDGKLKDAINCLLQARPFASDQSKLEKLISGLESKTGKSGLFAEESEEEVPSNYLEEPEIIDNEDNEDNEGGEEE